MRVYYPQAAVTLRIVWEDFGKPSAATNQVHTIQALARHIKISVNDYAKADTFELDLDARLFPFDPRSIRSCQVSCHLQVFAKPGERIKPREPKGGLDHNTIIMGFADDDGIKYSDTTRTVTLKGRDFTSIYIDAPWNGTVLPLDDTASNLIGKIMKQLKATGDIKLDVRLNRSLKSMSAASFSLGANSGVRNASQKESYWDVMQHVAQLAGLILYIELDRVVLTEPKILFNPDKAVQFFYGKNLTTLEFNRKIGRMKGFNVVVKSHIGKKLLSYRIPLQSKNLDIKGKDIFLPKLGANGKIVEGPESLAPAFEYVLPDVGDPDTLIEYGETIFTELGRQQIEGKFTTKDLVGATNETGNPRVDLTKLRNGAPIQIEIDSGDLVKLGRLATTEERTRYLLQIGYPATIAPVFAQTLGRFATPFYLKEISFDFDMESGLSLDVDFINRIETSNVGIPGFGK